MLFFSLYDWLNTPNRSRRDFGTAAKRTILSFLLFFLSLAPTILEHVIINMYEVPYPLWLHWLIYGFEFLAFIALVYGIFREKLAFIIPFIIISVLKLLVWGGYTIFYLIRLIINEINGEGGHMEPRSVAVIPGVVTVEAEAGRGEPGQLYYVTHDHWSNYWLSRVLGHLLILCTIHAITVCIAITVYQAVRRLLQDLEREQLPTIQTTSAVTVPQGFDKDAVILTRTTQQMQTTEKI